jgi:hypothetical protein
LRDDLLDEWEDAFMKCYFTDAMGLSKEETNGSIMAMEYQSSIMVILHQIL